MYLDKICFTENYNGSNIIIVVTVSTTNIHFYKINTNIDQHPLKTIYLTMLFVRILLQSLESYSGRNFIFGRMQFNSIRQLKSLADQIVTIDTPSKVVIQISFFSP